MRPNEDPGPGVATGLGQPRLGDPEPEGPLASSQADVPPSGGPADAAPAQPPVPSRWRTTGWVRWFGHPAALPLVFFIAALALYLPGITQPSGLVFDENHYVPVVRHHAKAEFVNPATGDLGLPYNFEHPLWAKYMIWTGIVVFGDNPFGWRIASVLYAAGGVAAAYLLGKRLFGHRAAGVCAAGLLLVENIYYLHAQLAQLDVFPVSLALLAFALLLGPRNEGRWAGVVFGLALASKYNVLFVWPAFLLISWLRNEQPRMVRRTVAAAVEAVVVPIAVLLFTYAPEFAAWSLIGGPVYAMQQWVETQVRLFTWDFHGAAWDECRSDPIEWLPMVWPTFYFQRFYADSTVQFIHSIGNAVTWWTGALVAISTVARAGWRVGRSSLLHLRREGVGALRRVLLPWSPEIRGLFAAGLFLSAYVPFFVLKRAQYMFYMVFPAPYLAIAAGGFMAALWLRGGRSRRLAVVWALAAVAFFVLFFPYTEGTRISQAYSNFLDGVIPWAKYNCPLAYERWAMK